MRYEVPSLSDNRSREDARYNSQAVRKVKRGSPNDKLTYGERQSYSQVSESYQGEIISE